MFKVILQQFRSQRNRGKLADHLINEGNSHEQVQLLVSEEAAFNREALIAIFNTTTAVIHLYYGGTIFVLNGLGFLTFLAARHLLPRRESYQKPIRDGNIFFAGLTIIPYFIKYGLYTGLEMPIGIVSKLAECGLIIMLTRDGQENQGREATITPSMVEAADLSDEATVANVLHVNKAELNLSPA